MKAQVGSRGIALLFPALDGGGWSTLLPGRFTPWKQTRYPFYRRMDGLQGSSGRVRKISLPSGFDPRTVQPLASRYTDCSAMWYVIVCRCRLSMYHTQIYVFRIPDFLTMEVKQQLRVLFERFSNHRITNHCCAHDQWVPAVHTCGNVR